MLEYIAEDEYEFDDPEMFDPENVEMQNLETASHVPRNNIFGVVNPI